MSGQPSVEWTHESKQSVYYNINDKKIRISDHLPKKTKADLHIIIPFNFADYFIIFANRTPMLIYSWKELTKFLSQYIFIEYSKKLSK